MLIFISDGLIMCGLSFVGVVSHLWGSESKKTKDSRGPEWNLEEVFDTGKDTVIL